MTPAEIEERVTSHPWGLVGHDWAVEMLKQHLQQDSLRHAYLISGPPGVGRRTLALRLAQALNCPTPAAPAEPCLECKTCRQIERMQYPDLAVLQADKEGGTLDVGQVRTLRQSMSLKPYQGRFRVAVLLRFQEANLNAANALLKLLEEPPAHGVLLITADTPEQLLPTINSRCEILRLRPMPVELVEEFLISRNADVASAHLLAHISGGRPGYALRMLNDKDALDFRARRLSEMQELFKSSRASRFAYAEKLTNRKKEATETKDRLRETLFIWLSFWRDVLLLLTRSGSPLINVDFTQEVNAMAERLDLPRALKLVRQAEAAIGQLDRNVNARLLVDVLLLDWPHA